MKPRSAAETKVSNISYTKVYNDNWVQVMQFANNDDFFRLLNSLAQEAIGTEFDKSMRVITSDWLGGLKRTKKLINRHNVLTLGKSVAPIWFVLNLQQELRTFIGVLFDMHTTSYIAYDADEDELIAVTDDPAVCNIRKYTEVYADLLVDGCTHFRFMVHGEDEMKYKQVQIKVTRNDWNAIN